MEQLYTFSSPSYFNKLSAEKKVIYLEKRIDFLLNQNKISHYDLTLNNCELTYEIVDKLVSVPNKHKFFNLHVLSYIMINDAVVKYLETFIGSGDTDVLVECIKLIIRNPNCSYEIISKFIGYLDNQTLSAQIGFIPAEVLTKLVSNNIINTADVEKILLEELRYGNGVHYVGLMQTDVPLKLSLARLQNEIEESGSDLTNHNGRAVKALMLLLMNNIVDEEFEIRFMKSVEYTTLKPTIIFQLVRYCMNVKRSKDWFDAFFRLVGEEYLPFQNISNVANPNIKFNYIFDQDVITYFRRNKMMKEYDQFSMDELTKFGGLELLANILPDTIHYNESLPRTLTKILTVAATPDCGDSKRTIYTGLFEPHKVHIGCFHGTLDEAIVAINKKYSGIKAETYIRIVKRHFDTVQDKIKEFGGIKGIAKICKADILSVSDVKYITITVDGRNSIYQLNVNIYNSLTEELLNTSPIDHLFYPFDLNYYKVSTVVLDPRIDLTRNRYNGSITRENLKDSLLIAVLKEYFPSLEKINFDFGREEIIYPL